MPKKEPIQLPPAEERTHIVRLYVTDEDYNAARVAMAGDGYGAVGDVFYAALLEKLARERKGK